MGVGAAVEAVRGEIAATLRGRDPHDQSGADRALIALDGTREKARLGANALLATSLAVARAAAADAGAPLWRYLSDEHPVQLPVPCSTCSTAACTPPTASTSRSS